MHSAAILSLLRVRGPCSGAELCRALGVSQPTLSRTVGASEGIVRGGAGRVTRYAALRPVPGLPTPVSLYEIGVGGSSRLARLYPVYPAGFYVESATPLAGFYDDLPWFLHDLRPRGFLGRRIPQDYPALGLPPDVRTWRSDHVLQWLNDAGVEVPGSLVVGGTSAIAAVAHDGTNPCTGTGSDYAELARRALREGFPGSSAGGEQPKFLATRGGVPVLVKFSPAGDNPPARRVADLLRAEALSLTLLGERGVAVPAARMLEGEGRVFLEVERFDRKGTRGRAGLVSVEALDAQFGGRGLTWTDTTAHLAHQGLLTHESAGTARWLDRFGAFIGNTDRHLGNLSYGFEAGRVGALAPVYDMLPMAFHPRDGEVVERPLPLPTLNAEHGESWRSAWGAARDYWQRITLDEAFSPDMRRIARASSASLEAVADVVRRLPATVMLLLLLPAALLACAPASTDAPDDSPAPDTASSSSTYGLDDCETTVAEGVPTFYAAYFRCMDISLAGDAVVLASNGLPPHPSSYYPGGDPNWVAWDDRSGAYHQNPNELSEQQHIVRVPLAPSPSGATINEESVDQEAGTSDEEYRMGVVGLALDGVALYSGLAAAGTAIAEEQYTFDTWLAHPDPRGSYHHHSANPAALAVLAHLGLVSSTTPGAAEVELYGVMCDGTAVLGCMELDGTKVVPTGLDAQGGHVHDLVNPEGLVQLEARYHTHLCEQPETYGFTPEIQYYDTCDMAL